MRLAIVKHVERPLLAAAVCVVVLSVGCGDDGPCASGSVGTIIVGKDAFVIEGVDQGFLAGGYSEDQVFPYADGSPFLTCRSVGSLVVREVIDGIDGDRDFPALEELGSIFVDFDQGSEPAVPLLAGFDSVVRFGGITGVLGVIDAASIGEVSGFNAVTSVDVLATPARVTGLQQLRVVEGRVDAGTLEGPTGLVRVGGELQIGGQFSGELELADLEDVGGDLRVEGTRLTSVAFPALSRVGGEYFVDGNPFERFAGAQAGARIEGNFTAQFNLPSNAYFEEWLVDEDIVVGGRVKVCLNGDPSEEGDTCNEI